MGQGVWGGLAVLLLVLWLLCAEDSGSGQGSVPVGSTRS